MKTSCPPARNVDETPGLMRASINSFIYLFIYFRFIFFGGGGGGGRLLCKQMSQKNYTAPIKLTIIALLSCFAFASNSTLSAFNSSLLFSSLFFSSSFAKTQTLKNIVQTTFFHYFHLIMIRLITNFSDSKSLPFTHWFTCNYD